MATQDGELRGNTGLIAPVAWTNIVDEGTPTGWGTGITGTAVLTTRTGEGDGDARTRREAADEGDWRTGTGNAAGGY